MEIKKHYCEVMDIFDWLNQNCKKDLEAVQWHTSTNLQSIFVRLCDLHMKKGFRCSRYGTEFYSTPLLSDHCTQCLAIVIHSTQTHLMSLFEIWCTNTPVAFGVGLEPVVMIFCGLNNVRRHHFIPLRIAP
ncbi:uncharacterized protein LOC130948103 [Arachis stenosperma]|uniref:uncharacterized protein LOC130948103 n=1 Tax=Arachis stenosperma TaxID=217475 RepID=UPI0025AC7F82|nr:uncharacterized protein LOC130948103 [Arachis stenosperma]